MPRLFIAVGLLLAGFSCYMLWHPLLWLFLFALGVFVAGVALSVEADRKP